MNNSVETLKKFRSIMHHLNTNNIDEMVQKGMDLTINKKELLWQIAEITHDRALYRPQLTKLYGKFTANLIEGGFWGTVGSGENYLSYILCKCYDAVQQSITFSERAPPMSNRGQNNYFVANCEFIGELYNHDLYPETIVWSFITDLNQGCNTLKMYCLCTLLKSTGAKLSKTYSLTNIVEHLLSQSVTRNPGEREIPLALRQLIEDIHETNATNWVYNIVPENIEVIRLEGFEDLLNDVIGDDVSISDKESERNLFEVQEEMLEDELPIVLEDEIPIVLEDDESARSRGSIDLLDDGDVVSLPDNTIDKTLSKTFSIHKLSKHLHLHMSKPNCINQISFVREDDKLILPVVSTVHQDIEDATDEIRENLILEDEVPISSTLEIAVPLCLPLAIETSSNEIQIVLEEDKLVLQELSAVLQVEEIAVHVSVDNASCPELLAALPDDQDTANVEESCCSIESIPQTRSERRKSVWRRFCHWSVKRLRALVSCVP